MLRNFLVTKGQILHDSTYMRDLEQSKSEKSKMEFSRSWGNSSRVSVWVDENIPEIDGGDCIEM